MSTLGNQGKCHPGRAAFIDGSDERFPVNARKLHAELSNRSNFREWIARRIEDGAYIEREDYKWKVAAQHNGAPAGNVTDDCHVTMRVALEMCEMELSSKGSDLGKLFVGCWTQMRQMDEIPEIPPPSVGHVDPQASQAPVAGEPPELAGEDGEAIDQMVARLNKSKQYRRSQIAQQGSLDGAAWVLKRASYETLAVLDVVEVDFWGFIYDEDQPGRELADAFAVAIEERLGEIKTRDEIMEELFPSQKLCNLRVYLASFVVNALDAWERTKHWVAM